MSTFVFRRIHSIKPRLREGCAVKGTLRAPINREGAWDIRWNGASGRSLCARHLSSLEDRVADEDRRGHEHPSPQAPRFLNHARKPFQAEPLEHGRGALHSTSIKVEPRADRRSKLHIQPGPHAMNPHLLLWGSHTYP